MPDEVRGLIVRRTAGNPFFVEELVRMLPDLGTLRRVGDNSWTLAERPDGIDLPDPGDSIRPPVAPCSDRPGW